MVIARKKRETIKHNYLNFATLMYVLTEHFIKLSTNPIPVFTAFILTQNMCFYGNGTVFRQLN